MVTHYRWRFAQFAVLASLIETLLKIQPILAWILDILANHSMDTVAGIFRVVPLIKSPGSN